MGSYRRGLTARAAAGSIDGERGSYPELVDALTDHGVRAKTDVQQLYRRTVFNALVSNVDDHLRNHSFLSVDRNGWSLSPAYDLKPTPTNLKARVLTTSIDLDESTCSTDPVESSASYFGLSLDAAREMIRSVAKATSTWRNVAAETGARPADVNRMSSAFEHDDLRRALAL